MICPQLKLFIKFLRKGLGKQYVRPPENVHPSLADLREVHRNSIYAAFAVASAGWKKMRGQFEIDLSKRYALNCWPQYIPNNAALRESHIQRRIRAILRAAPTNN